jgi:hypothetical protein
MVTLGGWSATSFQVAGGQQVTEAGTFMHEFGHTLNLRHGGSDDNNCKPNYLSVMSYSLTFRNMDPNRPLDYSRQTLATLDETNLSEPTSVGAPGNRRIIHGKGGNPFWTWGNWAVDWNRDGDTLDTGVSEDASRIDSLGCIASAGQMLSGQEDWSAIQFGFRDSSDFADGPARITPTSQIDVTDDQAVAAAQLMDVDDDGLSNADDNCPDVVNPGQENGVHYMTFAGDHCDDPETDGVADIDDNCPDTVNAGQENADGDDDGDACDECPSIATYGDWMVPAGDDDCDGFTTAAEGSIGTMPNTPCGADAWPPDFDNNNVVNTTDVLQVLAPYLGTTVPPTSPRRDLSPSGIINTTDVFQVLPPFLGTNCAP